MSNIMAFQRTACGILFSTLLLLSWNAAHAQSLSPKVHVVLFTHIEDNSPSADIGSSEGRRQYTAMRKGLLEMGQLARRLDVKWVLQPDWKFLLAALAYEDSRMREDTDDKNLLRYLRDDLGVAIDPHSHEKMGYNYTDVAHLLDSLGVGGSTVIGGHIWDPSIDQFQEWNRFRKPVPGNTYPWASWRGNILTGSGTPDHDNDPHPSGVWRPKDPENFWNDNRHGNIFCIGQYTGDMEGVVRLTELYRRAMVAAEDILTASIHILPADITRPGGLDEIEAGTLLPLIALRDEGKIALTDFTNLIKTWRSTYSSKAHVFFSDAGRKKDEGLRQRPGH